MLARELGCTRIFYTRVLLHTRPHLLFLLRVRVRLPFHVRVRLSSRFRIRPCVRLCIGLRIHTRLGDRIHISGRRCVRPGLFDPLRSPHSGRWTSHFLH